MDLSALYQTRSDALRHDPPKECNEDLLRFEGDQRAISETKPFGTDT